MLNRACEREKSARREVRWASWPRTSGFTFEGRNSAQHPHIQISCSWSVAIPVVFRRECSGHDPEWPRFSGHLSQTRKRASSRTGSSFGRCCRQNGADFYTHLSRSKLAQHRCTPCSRSQYPYVCSVHRVGRCLTVHAKHHRRSPPITHNG